MQTSIDKIMTSVYQIAGWYCNTMAASKRFGAFITKMLPGNVINYVHLRIDNCSPLYYTKFPAYLKPDDPDEHGEKQRVELSRRKDRLWLIRNKMKKFNLGAADE